jgi:membrane protease YdiL (CAAX protease family)
LDVPPLPAPPIRLDPASARVSAIIEIVLCSGVPSQFALTYVIALAGLSPLEGGHLSFGYVTTLLLLDATIMIGMIFWFLRRHGEKPRDVFIGTRPVRHEVWLGLPMTGVVFMLALIVLTTTQRLVPSLHNVPENPLQQLIATRAQAIIFAVVATIGGGLREEIQRAFILHRFQQHLGGAGAGLILYSLVFGLGHSLQGMDAVVTTTILGLFWGYVYLSRRSIIAPVVSHSGFNAAEIFQYFMMAK